MKMVIVGSGLAGTMAAGFFKSYSPAVFDLNKNKSKHNSIMRIKEPSIGHLLGCSLKEIEIQKAIYYKGQILNESDIRLSNMYSIKVNDKLSQRSINNLNAEKRFLIDGKLNSKDVQSPYKLIGIKENKLHFEGESKEERIEPYDICISTIPMPYLYNIKKLEFDSKPEFLSWPIYINKIKLKRESEIYQTLYVPGKELNIYRATIEGELMIIESVDRYPNYMEIEEIAEAFGLSKDCLELDNYKTFKQEHGKIQNIDDDLRRSIILTFTEKYNIYSLGRFATWNSIRLDDLVEDLNQIGRMINVSKTKAKYIRRMA